MEYELVLQELEESLPAGAQHSWEAEKAEFENQTGDGPG